MVINRYCRNVALFGFLALVSNSSPSASGGFCHKAFVGGRWIINGDCKDDNHADTIMADLSGRIRSKIVQESKCWNLDVVFLLDGSASVREENFRVVKDFVKNFTILIGIDEGRAHVGVVQFSHYYVDTPLDEQRYIQTHVKIGEFSSYHSFAAAVDRIQLHGYTTYTGHALLKVRSDFKNSSNYGKSTTKQVLVLITDGRATDPTNIPLASEQLRSLGVIPYSIGIGDYELSELKTIATGNVTSDERVFNISTFDELQDLQDKLKAEINGLFTLEDPSCRN